MHRIIEDGLEDYLTGQVSRDFSLHLEKCTECRTELNEFGMVSTLFREVFEVPETLPAPAPGFYARVSETIDVRKAASPWAFFSIDAVFGRRVAFASLLALALVGGFLVSMESDALVEPQRGPEAVIAQHDPVPHDATVDRDRMMVTVASFEQ